MLQEGATDIEYEVFVLEGGFADFQQLFRVSESSNTSVLCCSMLRVFSMILNWSKIGTSGHGIRFRRP